MAKCKVLAFLLCDRPTMDSDGKVTLHGLFDRIILPPPPASPQPKRFFVYYKVDVGEPCTVSLRVIDPTGQELDGPWRDSLVDVGLVQTSWMLTSTYFEQPGHYELELREESEGSEPFLLTRMRFVVDQGTE